MLCVVGCGTFSPLLKYRLCLETLPYEITRDPSTLHEHREKSRSAKKSACKSAAHASERPRLVSLAIYSGERLRYSYYSHTH